MAKKSEKVIVTRHAAFRWAQRIEKTVPTGQKQLTPQEFYRAVDLVQQAHRNSIPVPSRIVKRLTGATIKSGSTSTYWATVEALLVIQGSRVVTVTPWGIEAFASLMTREILGIWPDPPPNYRNKS